jgi:mRNA deadenylase 3'-5' endonuclease subunit Ccr4
VLQPPDLSVLQHGRPSAVLPSDHIPLVAEFELQPAAA